MASPTIDDLDPAVVAQNEAFLVTFLQEQYPSLDLSEGRVLRNLLIRPAAQFYSLNQLNNTNLQDSMSVIAIEANPALADPALVDAVLSNFRITRFPGALATGQITIVIANLITTPVQSGTIFAANGFTYQTTQSYVGVVDPAAITSGQQFLIVKRPDGLFAFTIPVVATAVGTLYNAKQGTRFTSAPTIAGVVDLFATADFSGGLNQETNQDLIDRFKLALSPAVFSGRANINSLLVELFNGLQATSIIGFGDPEMLRDRHNLFNISTGGKADIYARTAMLPVGVQLTKVATLIDADKQIWQFGIGRDDAPGFYTVDSILPLNSTPDQGGFEIVSDVRGLDLTSTDDAFVPQIATIVEGAYSRYQTAVVQFIDPDTDTTGLTPGTSQQSYQVTVRAMPNIADLQDVAVNRGRRNPQADYLVRAPVPAFSQVNLTVLYADPSPAPDVDAIKRAVVNRVSGLNFLMGQLPASVIYQAVQEAIAGTGTMVQAPIDIQVVIRKPSGDSIRARSADEIAVPDLPADDVTSRTTIFYMGVEDVGVTIRKIPALPV